MPILELITAYTTIKTLLKNEFNIDLSEILKEKIKDSISSTHLSNISLNENQISILMKWSEKIDNSEKQLFECVESENTKLHEIRNHAKEVARSIEDPEARHKFQMHAHKVTISEISKSTRKISTKKKRLDSMKKAMMAEINSAGTSSDLGTH